MPPGDRRVLCLTAPAGACTFGIGKRYSFKIKYRFQVFVPKRQILRLRSHAVLRSALTCLSVPFTFFRLQVKRPS